MALTMKDLERLAGKEAVEKCNRDERIALIASVVIVTIVMIIGHIFFGWK